MNITDELTLEKIDGIASLPDPVLRNLLITQSYSELSSIFAGRMGKGANWCTFATWASKQAGQTIRHEDLQLTLEHLLKKESSVDNALSMVATHAGKSGAGHSFEQLRDMAMCSMIAHATTHAADAVARGNKKVFEEIAREFCRFIATCLGDTTYDKLRIDNFCEKLKEGPAPDGQEYLAKGFKCYYQALFETDMQEKTQLNLLANLFIGFHEQTRLQPEIAEALNAPVDAKSLKNDLFNKLFSGASWWIKMRLFLQRLFGNFSDKSIEMFVQLIQPCIRTMLTAHLMTITLPPDNCLQLGHDLPVNFPADLLEVTNTDLVVLLAQVDPTPNSVLESGATDWANLPERMHYITDMFRCYHQCTDLFDAAFTEAQIEAMKSGRLPEGKL